MVPVLKCIGKYIVLLFFLVIHIRSNAQSPSAIYIRAKKIIDTLTSPAMHGRGYTSEGDKIAANYIAGFFKASNLLSWNNNYYQPFNFPVNTFPPQKNKRSFFNFSYTDSANQIYTFDKPGKDYIIRSSSPSFKLNEKNSAGIIWVDSSSFTPTGNYNSLAKIDLTGKLIIVNDKGITEKPGKSQLDELRKHAAGAKGWIILNHKKLTATVSSKLSTLAEIEILTTKNISKRDLNNFRIAGNYSNSFEKSYTSSNICGYVKGSSQPDSFVVFTAHYDHLGEMGNEIYFPGANDNASGTAMLLTLIDHYSKPENKPCYSIAFIAFAGEEIGLLGSKYYTENPLFPLTNIKFLINMDLLGTGEEGITVVNGSEYKPEFERLKQISTANNYLTQVKARGKAANSDHYYFSEKGVPCFFIYTMGGIKAYHDIYDVAATLPLTKFENIRKLLITFADW